MKLSTFFTSLLIIASFFLFIQKQQAQAVACPLPFDTKVNQNPATGLCYSENDPLFNPGLNTPGGAYSTCGAGGQVQCPGNTIAGLPDGNTCVVQINNQCFAGIGTSGFNTPGCTPSSTTPLPKCPTPMNLTVHVVDGSGTGVNNVTLTITYADAPPGNASGLTTTAFTDSTGTAIVKGTLYSGDHFIVIPSSQYYTFTPTQIGSNADIGIEEMNTIFSCGSALENGTNRPPCLFIATRNNIPLPSSFISSTGQAHYDSNLVNETTASTQQTFIVLGALGLIGYAVLEIGGGGGVK